MARIIKRRRDRQFWQQQVQAWQSSGLSATEYANEHQLCQAQFKRWRYRLNGAKHSVSPSFIPVEIAPTMSVGVEVQSLVVTGDNGIQVALTIPVTQLVTMTRALVCGQ